MRQYLKPERIHDGLQFWPEGSVLVVSSKGEILDIVAPENIDSEWEMTEMQGWLCPGFVNAHTHLELSHLKGKIEKGTGLMDFVGKIVRYRDAGPNEKHLKITEEVKKMQASGVVAVGDICNTSDAFEQHQIPGLYVHAFLEALGFNQNDATTRIEYVKHLQAKHQDAIGINTSKKKSSIVPHAPYSISRNLMQLINEHSENQVISIHNQELAAENEFFQHKTGAILELHQKMNINNDWFLPQYKNSLPVVWKQLNKAKQVLLVHNTFTSEEDIVEVNQSSHTKPYWVICLRTNLYIENALPPIPLLMKHNQSICIGTDSLASNDSLSIWDEICAIREAYPKISWEQLIKWATYNGAKALDIHQEIGCFRKGVFPGVVHLESAESRLIFESK